jgi:acyl carrier protein
MTEPDVRERLRRCFAAYFPSLSEEEIPRASVTSVADWDSMASVTLIGMVSEEFGIEVAGEDYERFVSFELILDYLASKAHVS